MPAKIIFSEQAREDLQQIFDWYEDRQLNLGDRFVAAIEEGIEKIATTPTASSVRYDNIRCKLIKNFPYLLHYLYDESTQIAIIYRIFHTSRKPFWDK